MILLRPSPRILYFIGNSGFGEGTQGRT